MFLWGRDTHGFRDTQGRWNVICKTRMIAPSMEYLNQTHDIAMHVEDQMGFPIRRLG